MKPLTLAVSTAALVALAASPALSASRHHVRHDHGAYAYRGYGPPLNAGGLYPPGAIYRQGHYLGTDPDPNVRFEIIRDPYFERK